MELYGARLHSGDDLREQIRKLADDNQVKAGVIICGAGALTSLRVRLAGAQPDHQPILEKQEDFEIVSLTGTISQDDMHVHISASDKAGRVWGGHLKEGCIVTITAEILILEVKNKQFGTAFDAESGFELLTIKDR